MKRRIVYQFPMGKVKFIKSLATTEEELVSIPYGKGKAFASSELFKDIGMVSIPYGKGKVWRKKMASTTKVSIPYGKGNVDFITLIITFYGGFNSLWERLRCCPRAKRLGNSTHATALREDEPQAKTDRQSATAKEDRSKRAYDNRTSIPYGKGKATKQSDREIVYLVSIPYGKGKG